MKIKKSYKNVRFSNVDPTGFTPVSPVVKNGILLHKLRAQGPREDDKVKRTLLQGFFLLTTGMPAIYANSVFMFPLYQTYNSRQEPVINRVERALNNNLDEFIEAELKSKF